MAETAKTTVCPLCKGKRWATAIDAIEADGRLINPRPAICMACDGEGIVRDERD
jgi:hypothetical protein